MSSNDVRIARLTALAVLGIALLYAVTLIAAETSRAYELSTAAVRP